MVREALGEDWMALVDGLGGDGPVARERTAIYKRAVALIRARDVEVRDKAYAEGKLRGRLHVAGPHIPIPLANYTTMGNPPRETSRSRAKGEESIE